MTAPRREKGRATAATRKFRLICRTVLVGALTVLPATGSAWAAPPDSPLHAVQSQVQYAGIVGSGSTWVYIAIQKWIVDLQQRGLQVTFDPTGSAQGRRDFANAAVDFAVSDVGYQGHDPVAGINDVSSRPYAYVPIAAGGMSFPYNIVVRGHRVTNLRLSGRTLAKIFTNKITNWDNPAITRNNNGHRLPSLPIVTVVPSEGAWTTATFTRYLNYEFPSLWRAFNHGHGGMTEYWPRQGAHQVAVNGSALIMNFIESASANGAIGIDEYAYPLQAGFPVAGMRNAAGYYVLPSEYNVAVALTQARINMNTNPRGYLLLLLSRVYSFKDRRSYPLASVSYGIMPTSPNDPTMQPPPGQFPAKWQTLAGFLFYAICQGQQYVGPVGFSVLPVNLVRAGFRQIDRIKLAAPQVDLSGMNIYHCPNPTFPLGHPNQKWLLTHAPMPPLCDKQGHGPCTG